MTPRAANKFVPGLHVSSWVGQYHRHQGGTILSYTGGCHALDSGKHATRGTRRLKTPLRGAFNAFGWYMDSRHAG